MSAEEEPAAYTPTTEEIREYVEVGGDSPQWAVVDAELDSRRAAAFDRWLTAHDEQLRAPSGPPSASERSALAEVEVPLPNGWQFIRLGTAGADAIFAAGFRLTDSINKDIKESK